MTLTEKVRIYENIQVETKDLEFVHDGLSIALTSDLINKEIFNDVRVVVFDSNYLYVFTKGEHVTNKSFNVEKIKNILQNNNFNIFKIKHSGIVGRNKVDYRGARAWLLADELETTAIDTKKFSNEDADRFPDENQPDEILDVIQMSPKTQFEEINGTKYSYLIDVIFHELGHIEHRRVINWQKGNEHGFFNSEESKKKFMRLINNTNLLNDQFKNALVQNISFSALREMYPMVIDQEAARIFEPHHAKIKHQEFMDLCALDFEKDKEIIMSNLKSNYVVGGFLARVIANEISSYNERKEWLKKLIHKSKL